MNLLRAELARFASRRIVRVALVGLAIVITAGMAIAYSQSSVDRTTQYETYASECVEQAQANAEGEIDLSGCPTVTAYGSDDRIRLSELEGVLGGTGPLFVLVAMLLAASSIGAEFGAGSLSTQLVFEPRRARVWTTKALAVALGTATVTAILVTVLAAELAFVAQQRGVTSGLEPGFWGDRGVDGLRLVAAAALGGLLGFSISGIARRTTAAVVVFVVLFIAEPLLYQVSDTFDGKLPLWTLFAFVVDPFDELGFDRSDVYGISSLWGAAVVPLVWVAGLLVFAGWRFHRSEIR